MIKHTCCCLVSFLNYLILKHTCCCLVSFLNYLILKHTCCCLVSFLNTDSVFLSLGKFQNPAVIEALLRLLEDPDPNIRAVAAISLGHTGIQEDSIIDRLIGLLKDSDRIVRQSACLTLGSMKAKKAIPHISNVWYVTLLFFLLFFPLFICLSLLLLGVMTLSLWYVMLPALLLKRWRSLKLRRFSKWRVFLKLRLSILKAR